MSSIQQQQQKRDIQRNSKLLTILKKKGNQKKLSLNTDTGYGRQRLQRSYYKNIQRIKGNCS